MRTLRVIVFSALAAVAVCVSTTVPAGASSAPSSPKAKVAAAAAVRELGVPFAWGGATPRTGFDDSGLVVWAFAQAGVRELPHFAGALWNRGVRVSKTQLEPGDLVFFNNAAHVGIYVGHGAYVDASHTGRPVRVARLAAQTDYTGAVRIR